ncbi:MAG: hypothetical protein ACRD6W_11565, partial [Nitrososphaerales archaeon]
ARKATSITVISVGVIVIVAIAVVAGYLVSRSPSTGVSASTSTSISSSSLVSISSSTSAGISPTGFGGNSSQQTAVLAQIAISQKYLDARDVTQIDKFYTPTSTVNWYGNNNGFGGVQKGAANIELLYAATLGYATSFQADFTDVHTTLVNPNQVNDTSLLIINGISSVVGTLDCTVVVSQEWVQSGGTWTIQKEDWDYITFNAQFQGEATVFPQWSMSLSGVNPNLADMHVIEWHYAPYVAAAVYVSLFSVLMAAVWARRSQQP